MQHNCEKDNENKKPHAIYSILIGTHEILSKVHTLKIKESQSIHHGYLNIPKVGKFVSPHLPDNHCHKIEHQNVTENQIKQVRRSDTDQFEKKRHTSGDSCKLNQVEHVHEYEDRIKELGQPIHSHESVRVNVSIFPQQKVNILSHGKHHEENEVVNIEE